jgi:hypothetical protein
MDEGQVFLLVAALHLPGIVLFAVLLWHLFRSTPDDPQGVRPVGRDDGGEPWRWRPRTRPPHGGPAARRPRRSIAR